jgi:hypothetical protein
MRSLAVCLVILTTVSMHAVAGTDSTETTHSGSTESDRLTGITCAAYNRTHGTQTGLVIGVFNHTEDLHGIQIGVLNHVEENPPWLRWLPLFNARF